jgi:hypothetical protein
MTARGLGPSPRKETAFMVNRFKVDCRKYPSEKDCTVTIAGSLEEVVELGWLHAKVHHTHTKRKKKKASRSGFVTTPKPRMIRRAPRSAIG